MNKKLLLVFCCLSFSGCADNITDRSISGNEYFIEGGPRDGFFARIFEKPASKTTMNERAQKLCPAGYQQFFERDYHTGEGTLLDWEIKCNDPPIK